MANITKLIQSPPGTREVYTIEQEVDASDSLDILTIAKTRSGGTLSQPKQLYFENTGSAPITLSMKIGIMILQLQLLQMFIHKYICFLDNGSFYQLLGLFLLQLLVYLMETKHFLVVGKHLVQILEKIQVLL